MQLALYKLRPDLERGSWGLRKKISDYKRVPTNPIGNLKNTLLVRRSLPEAPKWQRDLMAIASHDDLSFLANQNTAALLLIERGDERFILAYGTGRHAIDSSAIEPGFGLRVVANAIGPRDLKSAETRSMGRRGRSQRIVMPSVSPLHDLGIEPTEDLVRQLEGRPPRDFADGVAGGDILRLKIPEFSLLDLPSKLDEIMDRYHDARYKENFPFLDYFVRVSREDKELCARLDAALNSMILDGPGVDFASPDIDEYLRIGHYVLRSRRNLSGEMYDLDSEEVAALAKEWRLARPAQDVYVDAFSAEDGAVESRHRLLEYAVADVPLDDRRYAICSGMWYRLDTDNLVAIQRRIDAIPDLTTQLDLLSWSPTIRSETAYNEEAAKARRFALLDRRNFPIERPNQKVEIPNIDGYQDCTVSYLQQLSPNASFGRREDWTVVYAIATDKTAPLSESLFFFSKVNLDRTVASLKGLGVGFALARIDLKK
jgi:uncharacterized protein (TIGR04141 family)